MFRYPSLILAILLATPFFVKLVAAEEPVPLEPAQIPSFGFEQVVWAKSMVEKETSTDQMIVCIWTYAWKERQEKVVQTRYINEVQTRMVSKADGSEVEQQKIVKVPIVETVLRTTTAKLPEKKIEVSMPLKGIKAWNLRGEELSVDNLKQRFAKGGLAISLEKDEPPKLGPLHSASLNPELVFIFSEVLAKSGKPLPP